METRRNTLPILSTRVAMQIIRRKSSSQLRRVVSFRPFKKVFLFLPLELRVGSHYDHTMNQNPSPTLAPPGAGLPIAQRLFARWLAGPIFSKIVPLEQSRADYERHTARILSIASEMPLELRMKPVLIKPIGGLEDSSRYWSVNGVLEHLVTVSKAVEGVILTLGKEIVPPGSADPAKVKPKSGDQDWLPAFSEFAPGLLPRLDHQVDIGAITLNTKATFVHPWFGQFNARQWYWLLSRHQGIHAHQARLIADGLKSG